MTSIKLTSSSELSAQVLGLTDKHIHFFEQAATQGIDKQANSKPLGIHQLMLNDFQALVSCAAEADINLRLASGFRSFERQLMIWNNKFLGNTSIKDIDGESINISKLSDFEIVEAILLFSALPGASRHHWGCDIDIYAANLLDGQALQLEPWEYAPSGPMAKLTIWLAGNAAKFGFYLPYDCFRGGVAAEPWHLSYAPLAKQYQSAISVELLEQCLLQADILGKKAIIENLPEILTRYINNVNTAG